MELFEQNLPLSLKAKGGLILGKPKITTSIKKVIENAFKREQVGAKFDGEVEESVVYFYHGVGSINLIIHAKLQTTEAIPRLQQLAMAIIGDIR